MFTHTGIMRAKRLSEQEYASCHQEELNRPKFISAASDEKVYVDFLREFFSSAFATMSI